MNIKFLSINNETERNVTLYIYIYIYIYIYKIDKRNESEHVKIDFYHT